MKQFLGPYFIFQLFFSRLYCIWKNPEWLAFRYRLNVSSSFEIEPWVRALRLSLHSREFKKSYAFSIELGNCCARSQSKTWFFHQLEERERERESVCLSECMFVRENTIKCKWERKRRGKERKKRVLNFVVGLPFLTVELSTTRPVSSRFVASSSSRPKKRTQGFRLGPPLSKASQGQGKPKVLWQPKVKKKTNQGCLKKHEERLLISQT